MLCGEEGVEVKVSLPEEVQRQHHPPASVDYGWACKCDIVFASKVFYNFFG